VWEFWGKISLIKIGFEGVVLVHLAEDGGNLRAVVVMVTVNKYSLPIECGKF
jgi:hypothetical protein